jgi:hypothetical protein
MLSHLIYFCVFQKVTARAKVPMASVMPLVMMLLVKMPVQFAKRNREVGKRAKATTKAMQKSMAVPVWTYMARRRG